MRDEEEYSLKNPSDQVPDNIHHFDVLFIHLLAAWLFLNGWIDL